ncbi:SRPBCC family protein [Marinoscillum luteum]|uniref:Ligand-binding SRPBCC domain-containing protein n=1 Tax=Marinoscillum luteum TaxID=861051 RepID=A0ABW7N7A6_9BACT
MRILVSTRVQASCQVVKSGFTEQLFLSLNPPFPPVKLLRFDGCEKGDWVTLELNFLLFRQQWISEITEVSEEAGSWNFVDIGRKLPFFLKTWKHRHSVKQVGEGAEIVDAIRFTTGSLVSDLLLYPILWVQFLYRKPIYKRWFNKKPA